MNIQVFFHRPQAKWKMLFSTYVSMLVVYYRKNTFPLIFSIFLRSTWWAMISKSSFWISWLVYLFLSDLFKWSRMLLSLAPRRTISCIKLSSPLQRCSAIPYLPRYLKPRITSSRCLISSALSELRFFLDSSGISLHFGKRSGRR